MKKRKIVNFVIAAVLILNQAVFLLPNKALAQIIFDGGLATTSTETNYILFMNFISPPTAASGIASFSVEVSEEADVMFYAIKDSAVINRFPAVYQGNKIYNFKWDTAGLSNGTYTIKAEAVKNGYISINKQISVIVDNLQQTSFLSLQYESAPTMISAISIISVKSNVEADNVAFYLSGPQVFQVQGVNAGNNIYQFKIDPANLAAGLYQIRAVAKKGTVSAEALTSVKVEKYASYESPIFEAPLEMTFIENYQPPFSGEKKISVSLNQEADNVVFSIEGVRNEKISGIKIDAKTYYFIWNTVDFPNSYYKVIANAVINGVVKAVKSFSAQTENKTPITETTSTFTGESEQPLNVFINQKLISPISGDYRLVAKTNLKADKIDFSASGPRGEKFSGIRIDDYQFYFVWPTAKFPDGFYKISITAYQNGRMANWYGSVEIKNAVYTETKPQIAPVETERPIIAAPEIKQPVYENNNVMIECRQAGITSEEECKKYFSFPPECRDNGVITREQCDKLMQTPSECRKIGLEGQECEKFMSLSPECRQNGILDETKCREFMYKNTMPSECRKIGAKTQEECSKIIFLNNMPVECRNLKAATQEECDNIMRSRANLTPECDKAGIKDFNKCSAYMSENYMPIECKSAGIFAKEECDYYLRDKYGKMDNTIKTEFKPVVDFARMEEGMAAECREAGAKTKEECDKIMFAKNSPIECRQAGIADPEECKKHMEATSLPEECRSAGVKTKEECEKTMFLKQAPQECKDAGIGSAKECENFIFKKYAPKECVEAGTPGKEACNKLMFEKYGNQENISADKLPLECQKAGAKTKNDCEKIMKKIYMPQECQSQGITGEDECQKYMEFKNMPQECRSAGVKTMSECDKAMFKKYGPKECLSAGIEDEKECENYMFNKYAPQVRCENVDDWQCKNSIQERHLGGIAAKQAQFAELKEMTQKAGETATVAELKSSLDAAKEIIPLQNDKVKLRIIAAKEELVLNDGDKLIQTAPMAVMVDSDGDGLPDDMEIRIGTDSQNSDSDGDGYTDGDEMKSDYNPSGEGRYDTDVSPIDEAIIQNKTLGQPKTEGDESETMAVNEITNNEGAEENAGYSVAGQSEPNSVVTLYIYSDLPLVATAKADEFGNWQYELGDALNEGEHEIYVAVNDNTGKVLKKSKPLSFFIKEAKAVSVKDFVAPASQTHAQKTESMLKYYIYVSLLIIALGIVLFVAYHVQRKKEFFK